VVHSRLCRSVRFRLCLWLPTGRMAIWIGRSGLGRYSRSPLANEDNERLRAVAASASGRPASVCPPVGQDHVTLALASLAIGLGAMVAETAPRRRRASAWPGILAASAGALLAFRSYRRMGEPLPMFQLTATEPAAQALPRSSGKSPIQCVTNGLQKARLVGG
jgi:hypothetical protein